MAKGLQITQNYLICGQRFESLLILFQAVNMNCILLVIRKIFQNGVFMIAVILINCRRILTVSRLNDFEGTYILLLLDEHKSIINGLKKNQ